MPKTFQEILPALEERLEQAQQGALPLGHAMELRRREQRQARRCPSDEEICGYVDGKLRTFSKKRWAEVRWHVQQCPQCQDDVEGLCEALELNPRDVAGARQSMRQSLSRVVAPIAAVAAVLVFAFLGVQTYMPTLIPTLPGGATDSTNMRAIETPLQTRGLVDRQQVAPSIGGDRSDRSTMKVSIPSDGSASPVVRVAVCSETERPTCAQGMTLLSVVGAKCEVAGDANSCFAESAAGGCAVCLVLK